MFRLLLFVAAVFVLYWGGFVYDEVGPGFYAVIVAIIAATPLLLKFTFWKKIVFMVPLIVLRVVGKVLLSLFGKNALSKLLAKYGLLEVRFNKMIASIDQSKSAALYRWRNTRRSSQAYLILIFFPVVILIALLLLIVEFIRLRFVQFIIEKIMQSVLLRWTKRSKLSLLGKQSEAKNQNRIESSADQTSASIKSEPEQAVIDTNNNVDGD